MKGIEEEVSGRNITSGHVLLSKQKSEGHKLMGVRFSNSIKEDGEIDHTKLLVNQKPIANCRTFGFGTTTTTTTTLHSGSYNGNDVAVMVIDLGKEAEETNASIESVRKAFIQQVSVWNQLGHHPNVTKLIGATSGTSEFTLKTEKGEIEMPSSICCAVIEFLHGGTLKSYLIKHRLSKLPLTDVIQLSLDLARGLSYLHSRKIIHRDIKTENLLLDNKRTIKITGFRVARVEGSNPNEMTGQAGTLGYMAPEVLAGDPYDRKCDVYSFGICLWEIYCCEIPYSELGPLQQTSAAIYEKLRPEIPDCCPSSLANVMKRCWHAEPKMRPEMEDVVKILEAIDTSEGGGGMTPHDLPQPRGCFCFFGH